MCRALAVEDRRRFDDDEQGGLALDIAKGRLCLRLIAPCDEERECADEAERAKKRMAASKSDGEHK